MVRMSAFGVGNTYKLRSLSVISVSIGHTYPYRAILQCHERNRRIVQVAMRILALDTSQPKSSLFVQKVQKLSGLASNLGRDNPGSSLEVIRQLLL
jgi:hypothetical protein